MSKKSIKTRIQHKYDLIEHWKNAINFIPLKGEIVIAAPNMEVNSPNNVYKSIPHRIKVGDGFHKLSELSYVGRPTVTVGSASDPEKQLLTGFESVSLLTPDDHTIPLQINLQQEFMNSKDSHEPQEYFHHQVFVKLGMSSANDPHTVTLTVFGDGKNIQDGISANDVEVVLKPTKCLLSTWHTGNTVANSVYNIPCYQCVLSEDSSFGSITYQLIAPADKDADNKYLYGRLGVFKIDIKCFLDVESDTAHILIENDFLIYCAKQITHR